MIQSLLNKSASIFWHFIVRSLQKRFRSLPFARFISPIRDHDIDFDVDKRHVSVSRISFDCDAINDSLPDNPFKLKKAIVRRAVWTFPWDFRADDMHLFILREQDEARADSTSAESESILPSPPTPNSADEKGEVTSERETRPEESTARLPPQANSAVLRELLSNLTELVSSAVKNASFNIRRIRILVYVSKELSLLLQCRRVNCTFRFTEAFNVNFELHGLTLSRLNAESDLELSLSQNATTQAVWLSTNEGPLRCSVAWTDQEDARVSIHLPSLQIGVDSAAISKLRSCLSTTHGDSSSSDNSSEAHDSRSRDEEPSIDGESEDAEQSIGRLSWLRRGIERLTGLEISGGGDANDFEEITSIFGEKTEELDEESRNAVEMFIGGTSELREFLHASEVAEEQPRAQGIGAFFRALFSSEGRWADLHTSSKSITFELLLPKLGLHTITTIAPPIALDMTNICIEKSELNRMTLSLEAAAMRQVGQALHFFEVKSQSSLALQLDDGLTRLELITQFGSVSVALDAEVLRAVEAAVHALPREETVAASSSQKDAWTPKADLCGAPSRVCDEEGQGKNAIRTAVRITCPQVVLSWTEPSLFANLEVHTIVGSVSESEETSVQACVKACLVSTAGDEDPTRAELMGLAISRTDSHKFGVHLQRLGIETNTLSPRLIQALFSSLFEGKAELPLSPSPSTLESSPCQRCSTSLRKKHSRLGSDLFSVNSNVWIDGIFHDHFRLEVIIAAVEVSTKVSEECGCIRSLIQDAKCSIQSPEESSLSTSLSFNQFGAKVDCLGRVLRIQNAAVETLLSVRHSSELFGEMHHLDRIELVDVAVHEVEMIVDSTSVALIALFDNDTKLKRNEGSSNPVVDSGTASESHPPVAFFAGDSNGDADHCKSIKHAMMRVDKLGIICDDGDLRRVFGRGGGELATSSRWELTRLSIEAREGSPKTFRSDAAMSVSAGDVNSYFPIIRLRGVTYEEVHPENTNRTITVDSSWIAISAGAASYLKGLVQTVSDVRLNNEQTLLQALTRFLASGEAEAASQEETVSLVSAESAAASECEESWTEDIFFSDLVQSMGNQNQVVDRWKAEGGLRTCETRRSEDRRLFTLKIKQFSVNLNSELSSIASIAQTEIVGLNYALKKSHATSHCIDIESLLIKDRVRNSKFENILQPYRHSKGDAEAFYLAAPEEREVENSTMISVNVSVTEISPGDSNSQDYLMVRRVATQSQGALSINKPCKELVVDLRLAPFWLTLDFETLFCLQAYFDAFNRNEPNSDTERQSDERDSPSREDLVRKLVAVRWTEPESEGIEEPSSPEKADAGNSEQLMFRSFSMSPIFLRFDSLPTNPLSRSDGLLTSLNLLNSICTLEGLDFTLPQIKLQGLMTSKELISRLIKTISDKSNRSRLVRQVARGWPVARSLLDLSSSLSGLLGEVLKESDLTKHCRARTIEAEMQSLRQLREIFDRDDWEDNATDCLHESDASSRDGSSSAQLFQLETTEADTLLSWTPSAGSHRAQLMALTQKVLMWVDLQGLVSVRALVGRAKSNLPQTLQHSEAFFRLLGLESLKMTQRIVSGCTRTLSSLENSLSDLLLTPEAARSNEWRRAPAECTTPPAWDLIERGADQFYQPCTATEGLTDAVTHLRRGWRRTLELGQPAADPSLNLLSLQAVNTIARVLPIFLLRPIVSLSQAINSAILGARNQLDPRRHDERCQTLRAPHVSERL